MNSFRWDDDLDGSAKEIARHSDTPLRVKAGPGTGKTYSLKRHVARLIQDEQVLPQNILVSTFTRTAAGDLRRELEALEVEGVKNVKAGTLHSLCFEILSSNDVLKMIGRTPRPLLKFEERFLLEDVKGPIVGGVADCRKRLKAFDAAWARLQHENPGWPHDETDRQFQKLLLEWLLFHRAILIGELVPEALKYLRNNSLAPEHTRFSHVIVDEYQDLNKADQVLLDLLSAKSKFLVVGDENQSIYSFRHANPQGIVEFDKTHANTEDKPLNVCRRCPEKVVKMANELISHNVNASNHPLQVHTSNPSGEVMHIQWETRDDEAAGIASLIKARIGQNIILPGDVLILATSRQIGYAIRDNLEALKVDAKSFFVEEDLDGDPHKLDECNAQQAYALLTLLVDETDRSALRAWLGFGHSSLQTISWARLRQHCIENQAEPFSVLTQAVGSEDKTHFPKLLDRFRLLLAKLKVLRSLKGHALVNELFPIVEPWAEPFQTMAAWLDDNGKDDFDADKLLEAIRQGITQPELPQDVAYVRIMSLYKSKGLTAKMVVIAGCVEGLLPRQFDARSSLGLLEQREEQRRLLYVAITRPRETLLISSFRKVDLHFANTNSLQLGKRSKGFAATIASTFIHELGSTLLGSIAGHKLIEDTQS